MSGGINLIRCCDSGGAQEAQRGDDNGEVDLIWNTYLIKDTFFIVSRVADIDSRNTLVHLARPLIGIRVSGYECQRVRSSEFIVGLQIFN